MTITTISRGWQLAGGWLTAGAQLSGGWLLACMHACMHAVDEDFNVNFWSFK